MFHSLNHTCLSCSRLSIFYVHWKGSSCLFSKDSRGTVSCGVVSKHFNIRWAFQTLVFQRIFTVLANLLCLLWRCFVVCAIDNPKAQNIQFVPCVYVSAALFRTAMDTKIVELQRAEKTALEKATKFLPRFACVPPGSLRCEYPPSCFTSMHAPVHVHLCVCMCV